MQVAQLRRVRVRLHRLQGFPPLQAAAARLPWKSQIDSVTIAADALTAIATAMALDYDKLMRMKLEPTRQTYSRKDTILYAPGVGVGANDPFDAEELKYAYEQQLVASFRRVASERNAVVVDFGRFEFEQ